jgi:hypothetical protein
LGKFRKTSRRDGDVSEKKGGDGSIGEAITPRKTRDIDDIQLDGDLAD